MRRDMGAFAHSLRYGRSVGHALWAPAAQHVSADPLAEEMASFWHACLGNICQMTDFGHGIRCLCTHSGVLGQNTRLGKACRFVCGEGRFCCPDAPPPIFDETIQKEDEEIFLNYARLP
jgi:hypothetical protein